MNKEIHWQKYGVNGNMWAVYEVKEQFMARKKCQTFRKKLCFILLSCFLNHISNIDKANEMVYVSIYVIVFYI